MKGIMSGKRNLDGDEKEEMTGIKEMMRFLEKNYFEYKHSKNVYIFNGTLKFEWWMHYMYMPL